MGVSIRKLLDIGLAHVFGAYTLNKAVSFISCFLLVRILSKTDYGYFSSAFNTYSFFNIFTGLGMLSAELLFCTENRESNEKKAIYRYTLVTGLIVDLFLAIILASYGYWGPISMRHTRIYIIMFSMLLCFEYFTQYLLCVFRTKKDNKSFSALSLINSVSYMFFSCGGAFVAGVSGTIFGRYFACLIVIVIGIARLGKLRTEVFNHNSLNSKLKKEIWNYSIKSGTTSFLNRVIYLIDVELLSNLIANPDLVASYKFATLIPESISFIPQAVIVTVMPYFIGNINNTTWIRTNTKRIMFYMGIFNLLITSSLIVFAPIIIALFGGERYEDSIVYFRILSISYFFLATFRLFGTNLLAVFRKVTFNIIAATITGILNLILDYYFIINYQGIGAALATVFSVVIGSFITFPYLIYVINHNKLNECVVSKNKGNT